MSRSYVTSRLAGSSLFNYPNISRPRNRLGRERIIYSGFLINILLEKNGNKICSISCTRNPSTILHKIRSCIEDSLPFFFFPILITRPIPSSLTTLRGEDEGEGKGNLIYGPSEVRLSRERMAIKERDEARKGLVFLSTFSREKRGVLTDPSILISIDLLRIDLIPSFSLSLLFP